ncbi:MAG: hypothetical protein ACFCA4_18350 [Cyanophyceae cyanobacterium]
MVQSFISHCFSPRRRAYFWGLCLAIIFALIFGGLGLSEAFDGDYVVQDDARQYVFWMQRWQDSELFPDDLIADYFSSVAPAGYRAIFYGAFLLGIPPLIFAKILPLGLGVAIAVLAYRVAYRWCPIPLAAFLGSLLLQQSLWMKDDVAAAAPRSFAIPLLLAFMDAWLIRRDRPRLALAYGVITLALLGLISPPYLLIAAGMLGLGVLKFLGGGDRQSWQWLIVGWGITLAVVLPYLAATGGYGPTVSAELGRTMAEFRAGGRASLFDQPFWEFWIVGKRTNFFPKSLFTPVTLIPGALYPFWTIGRSLQRRDLQKHSTTTNPAASRVVIKLLLSSTVLFFLAHATLFTLHLPSRYTGHSLRIAIALSSGVAWCQILQRLFLSRNFIGRVTSQKVAKGVAIALTLALITYPVTVSNFPLVGYKTGAAPELYQFLKQQPKTIRIGSIAKEADQLPTFAARSVVVSKEYSVPYQIGYYSQIQRRVSDLITAQYTADLNQLLQIVQRYNITHWLLGPNAFAVDYLANNGWLKQYQPTTDQAIETLVALNASEAIAPSQHPQQLSEQLPAPLQNSPPLLLKHQEQCKVGPATPTYAGQLIDIQCVLNLSAAGK